MILLYNGHVISGRPEEIKEFLILTSPTTVGGSINSSNLGCELIPDCEAYYQGKPISMLDDDTLRDAMYEAHLDKLCDVENMTRDEMLSFIQKYCNLNLK